MTPKWRDVDTGESHLRILICLASLKSLYFADNYTKLCTIEADLSRAISTLPKVRGKGSFLRVDYDIILLFGMTELKAQFAWTENVSGPHMLFNPTDIGLILRLVLGRRETVRYKLFLIDELL